MHAFPEWFMVAYGQGYAARHELRSTPPYSRGSAMFTWPSVGLIGVT